MTDPSDHPTSRTVEAVAEAEDVEQLAVAPPLAAVVDSEALGTLLEDASSDPAVHFTHRSHDAPVDASDRVQGS
jgi:hypothetical protein